MIDEASLTSDQHLASCCMHSKLRPLCDQGDPYKMCRGTIVDVQILRQATKRERRECSGRRVVEVNGEGQHHDSGRGNMNLGGNVGDRMAASNAEQAPGVRDVPKQSTTARLWLIQFNACQPLHHGLLKWY